MVEPIMVPAGLANRDLIHRGVAQRSFLSPKPLFLHKIKPLVRY
jgi:hypothetical protein